MLIQRLGDLRALLLARRLLNLRLNLGLLELLIGGRS